MKRIRLKRVIISIILTFAVLHVFLSWLGHVDKDQYVLLDDGITVDVYRNNGTVDHYDLNRFDVLDRGEVAVAKVYLPEERKIADGGITFRIPNAAVKVYFEQELLYSYGENLYASNLLIGGVYVRFKVPEAAWGKSLRFECIGSEQSSFSSIFNVALMHEKDLVKYPVIGHEMGFMIYITMFIISNMMLFYFILNGNYNSVGRQGIYLSAFALLISIWIISYTGAYIMFSNRMQVYANAEYIALFGAPLPFVLYVYEQQKEKKYKRLLATLAAAWCIFWMWSLVSSFIVRDWRFPCMVKYFHILLGISGTVDLYLFIKTRKEQKRLNAITMTGFSSAIVLFALDAIIFNVNKYTHIYVVTRRYTMSEGGVMLFIATMMLSYGIRVADYVMGEREKKKLEELAYQDSMTKLINRAGCYEMMKWINSKKNFHYEVIYFDVNSLKKANDMCGHEVGDELIKLVASRLHECFDEVAFCGRLGGDEFIVISWTKVGQYTKRLLGKFEKELSEENEREEYPFEISVSYGVEVHTKEDTRTAEEIIKAADANMYSKKKLRKQ